MIDGNINIPSLTANDMLPGFTIPVYIGGNVQSITFEGFTKTLATTGSNIFTGDQIITGSLGNIDLSPISNSIKIQDNAGNYNYLDATQSYFYSSSNTYFGLSQNANNGGWTGWNGPAIVGNSLNTRLAFIGFQNANSFTDGRVSVLTPLIVSNSLTLQPQDPLTSAAAYPNALAVSNSVPYFSDGVRWKSLYPYYGVFQHNQNVTGSANVSYSFALDTTDEAYGISITSGSRITFQYPGTYDIQFSAQIAQGAGKASIVIWFKYTGSNVPESATRLNVAGNDYAVAAWNFMKTVEANSYMEIAWQSDLSTTVFPFETASGNFPAIPSLIVTVNEVR